MKKVAIVTGGSRGIGFGIVLELLKNGYDVVTASRGPIEENGDPRLLELLEKTDNLDYIKCDISVREDREALIELTMKKYGMVHLLVNNAGLAPKVRKDILEVTEDSWDYVMNANLKGTMFLTQSVVNLMLRQSPENGIRGMVINIGSLSAYASSPNRVEYCVSKAGVSVLTKVYAERLAKDLIYVYEIRPGVIATKMTEVVKDKYDGLISRGDFPIARWGQPEDIAAAVSVLCEGKLLYSTGEVINVDGGFHIRRL